MALETLPEDLARAWEARTIPRDLAPWRELLGPHVPEDFGRVRSDARAERSGFLVGSADAALAAPNAFEHFVVTAQQTSPTVLRQAFCSVWFVASIPAEGDCIMAHFDRDRALAQVVRHDHETGFFFGPIAADLPTFDALADLAERADAKERLDAAAFEPLAGRFSSHFPLPLYLDRIAPAVAGTKAKDADALVRWLGKKVRHRELELPSNVGLLQGRSEWIVTALAEGRVEAIPEQQLDATPDDAALALPRFATYSPTPLYWIFRTYLLGEDEQLDRVLAAVRGSSSRLVRDAVKIVEDARSGARSTIGAVSLAELRAKAQALVARMRDPFPPRFEVGPVVFERRDALASGLAPQAVPQVPIPAAPADAGMFWGGRFAVPHPDGKWVLTHGMRPHPRAGRHPSIPSHEDVLFEVASDTGEARALAVVSSRVSDAWYVTPDLIAVHDGAALSLYERHGERAWLTESMRLAQRRLWRSPDGRTVVATGGLELGGATGPAWVPQSVEVVRIDDRHLVHIGEARVPLAFGATCDGALVLCDDAGRAAYLAEGIDRVSNADLDGTAVVVRPTCFFERATPPRVGPNAVLDALGPMDMSMDLPRSAERCLVLRGAPGNVFEVKGGDATGVFALDPPLSGGNVYWDILDADRALVTVAGNVYVADLAARTTRKAVELGARMPFVVKAGDGCAGIEGDALVLHRPAPEGPWPVSRRVVVGPGAAIDWCYLDGRVLAVTRADCPLILLAVRGADLWLLGAADPKGPLAGAQIASVALPNGFWRMLVKANGHPVLEAHALGRAFAHAVETREPDVGDEIGAAPWTKRPIRFG